MGVASGRRGRVTFEGGRRFEMQFDQNYDDDDAKGLEGEGKGRRFADFDCPDCNANNPHDGFGDGDEIRCYYCGMEYTVTVTDEGRLKLKEL
jgi:hypothetical protein